MTQQDIFKLLLLVLLGSNNQLQGGGEINYGSLSELIIIALLFNLACTDQNPGSVGTDNANTNTTF